MDDLDQRELTDAQKADLADQLEFERRGAVERERRGLAEYLAAREHAQATADLVANIHYAVPLLASLFRECANVLEILLGSAVVQPPEVRRGEKEAANELDGKPAA